MKVLLTGAFGFLGGRLAEALRATGITVVVSGRRVPPSAQQWAQEFETRIGDVLDPAAVGALVQGVDAVVHLAAADERLAATDPPRALAISGEGTWRMLRAAREAGAKRFVFFSTFHVYGPSAPTRIDEDTPTKAAHPYSIAHLAGEGFSRQALGEGFSSVILRVSNGYGCPTRLDVDRWTLAHNDFCRQAMTDKRIVLKTPGLQQRDFVWIGDIARATRLVLDARREDLGESVFNLGGDMSLSVLALAERVRARAMHLLGVEVAIERPQHPVTASTPVVLSVERLKRLGYAPEDKLDEETDRLLQLLKAHA